MNTTTLQVGDTVRYSADFLRSMGLRAVDLCVARGRVINLEPFGKDGTYLARVDWSAWLHSAPPPFVNTCNLEKI